MVLTCRQAAMQAQQPTRIVAGQPVASTSYVDLAKKRLKGSTVTAAKPSYEVTGVRPPSPKRAGAASPTSAAASPSSPDAGAAFTASQPFKSRIPVRAPPPPPLVTGGGGPSQGGGRGPTAASTAAPVRSPPRRQQVAGLVLEDVFTSPVAHNHDSDSSSAEGGSPTSSPDAGWGGQQLPRGRRVNLPAAGASTDRHPHPGKTQSESESHVSSDSEYGSDDSDDGYGPVPAIDTRADGVTVDPAAKLTPSQRRLLAMTLGTGGAPPVVSTTAASGQAGASGRSGSVGATQQQQPLAPAPRAPLTAPRPGSSDDSTGPLPSSIANAVISKGRGALDGAVSAPTAPWSSTGSVNASPGPPLQSSSEFVDYGSGGDGDNGDDDVDDGAAHQSYSQQHRRQREQQQQERQQQQGQDFRTLPFRDAAPPVGQAMDGIDQGSRVGQVPQEQQRLQQLQQRQAAVPSATSLPVARTAATPRWRRGAENDGRGWIDDGQYVRARHQLAEIQKQLEEFKYARNGYGCVCVCLSVPVSVSVSGCLDVSIATDRAAPVFASLTS